ncbi:MAG: alpha-amylase [Phycisphaerae bacterium]|nr:MAG: alpha-amylase [Phycisphaerae bacterium]
MTSENSVLKRLHPPCPLHPGHADALFGAMPQVWLVVVLLALNVAVAQVGPVNKGDNPPAAPKRHHVPAWAADAIWYQVFVARFANGETSNDPPGTLAWTNEWEQFHSDEQGALRRQLLDRCYGGDLQGLRDKLNYLAELGINAIYLNPVFQADTQHKYDTADHRHIDDSFGIADSRLALSGETEDPATWQFSKSDRLFLELLKEAHARGIRVMIDGVFNHVGQSFWAWEDVKRNGRESRYANWFAVTKWEPTLAWNAWDGPNGRLVNFRQVENGLDPDVERYLFDSVRRWMDPNGDGDPSDGVDGWRLDAAERVPHGFWRRFRRVVKSINPDALIAGEIWIDPAPWMDGEQFDVVTNYPVAFAILELASAKDSESGALSMTDWSDQVVALNDRFDKPVIHSMINLLDSHDTARAITQLNRQAEKNPDPNARSPMPQEVAFDRLKLAAFLQFTLPGAPMIYYGDEIGMYGMNDPFCRAPMWWNETNASNNHLLQYYRQLVKLRSQLPELRRGSFQIIHADTQHRTVAISRHDTNHRTMLLINADAKKHSVELVTQKHSEWLELFHTDGPEINVTSRQGRLRVRADKQGRVTIDCNPRSGVLLREVRDKLSSES